MSKHLAFLLTCLSLLFGAYAAAAEYKTQQALDLVRQGTAMLNLASPDMPTYRLSATVRLTKLQTQDLVGTYVEQGSAGQQRSDLIVGDYKELYIQSQGKAWRSKSDRPLRVAEALAPLIPHSFSADPGKDWKLRLRESKVSGEKLQCVTAEPKNGLPAEWCFASGTKTLRRFSRGSWKYLYLDHQSFGSRNYPRLMRTYEDGVLVAELKITELTPAAPDPKVFQTSDRLEKLPGALNCGPLEAQDVQLVTKVQPEYPPAARMTREQGTVALYAITAPSGQVKRVSVVSSAGKRLDEAATEAVMQWVYTPYYRCGEPAEHDTIVTVNFSLPGQ